MLASQSFLSLEVGTIKKQANNNSVELKRSVFFAIKKGKLLAIL